MIAPFPNIVEKRKIKKESPSKAASRQIAQDKEGDKELEQSLKNGNILRFIRYSHCIVSTDLSGKIWRVNLSKGRINFQQRSANSIKNRFYTVIRTFLKLLFRYHPSIINKLPHEIASKTILKFYQSREQFLKFHDFGKKTMRKLDYNINSNHLKSIVQQHRQQIQQIYNLIFKIKEREEKELPGPEDQIIKPKTQNQNICSKRTKIEQNLCGNKAYEENEEKLQDSQGLIQPKVQVQPQTDLFSLGYSISSPSYIFFVPYTNFSQGTPQINYFQPRF